MAVKTFFATNTLLSSVFQELSETSPGAGTVEASPATGWVVAKTAAARYSAFLAQTERAAATFGTTVLPGAAAPTANALRSTSQLNGSFASANWTFTFACLANTVSSQAGRFRLRLWRSANADGSGATDISGADQVTAIRTLSASSAGVAVTFNPGVITLTNEYLFVTGAWEITTAGGSNSANVRMTVGDAGTRVVTADFTAAGGGATSLAFPHRSSRNVLLRR